MSAPIGQGRRIPGGVWIFLLAFAVRVLWVLIPLSKSLHFLPDGDDMKFYSDWALRIDHGQLTDGKAFYGLPGYAYLLALIFLISGQFDPFTVGLLQAVVDAGIAVLLWKISREVFAVSAAETETVQASRRPDCIGLGAALAWIFFTPAQAFSAVTMPTVFLVFAYYLCVWFALKTRSSSCWRPWIWFGLLIGVIATMVATIFFVIPLMVVAIYLSFARESAGPARWAKAVTAVAVLVAGIYGGSSPVWIHNYFIAHEPVMLTAHSGINLWIGNNPTSTGYPKMPPGIRASQEGALRDSITLAERENGRPMKRWEVSKYWSAKADAYISAHRTAWMRLIGVKIKNFWNAYQYDDLSIIKLLRDDGVLPPGLKFGFIAALGLAGMVPVLIRFRRSGWVLAAVLLHMCAILPVFVTERYRLAAVPGLMILGVAGLWVFWDNCLQSRWKSVGIYLALCAGAAWFVSISPKDLVTGKPNIELWSLDFYKAGIRANKASELELERQNADGARDAIDRAQRNLEIAYSYVPNNEEIDFALGHMWLTRAHFPWTDPNAKARDENLARTCFSQALRLNPHHEGTLNNWGALEMDVKHWDRAERFFLEAARAEPENAKAYYLIAMVQKEMGKIDEAKAAIQEALRLQPNQKQFLELQQELESPPTIPVPAPAPNVITPPSASPPPPPPPGPAVQ
jgi:hypothetical protein